MLADVGFLKKKKKLKKNPNIKNSAFFFFKNFVFRPALKLTVLLKSSN